MSGRRYPLWLHLLVAAAALSVLVPAAEPPRAAHAVVTRTFTNSNAITIPDSGAASPYPSQITIDSAFGQVTAIKVTLHNLTHSYPDDLEIALGGPEAWGVVLMTDVGGPNPGVTNRTVSFSSTSATAAPDTSAPGAGPYMPTQGTPSGHSFSGFIDNPDFSTMLFFDAPVNGTWSLYVLDDAGGDVGVIAGGWSLELTYDPAPTISDIPNQVTAEDTPLTVTLTVADDTAPAADIEVAAEAVDDEDEELVPSQLIEVGGSGAARTIRLRTVPNRSGTANIRVFARDGNSCCRSVKTFRVTVTPVDDPPIISNLRDWATVEDTPTPPIPLFLRDVDSPIERVILAGSSSNPALVPSANITFGGSGASRTVTVAPVAGQSGTATITVKAADDTSGTEESFELMVGAANDGPTISDIPDQATAAGAPLGPLPFTVGDADTTLDRLAVSASSSNPGLVPSSGIVLGGAGAERTLTVTPAPERSGTATITLTVSDGALTATDGFVLTVAAAALPAPPGGPPVTPASADLTVRTAVTPSRGTPGRPLQYLVTVTNRGPSPATGVTLADTLTGVHVGVTRPSQGSCRVERARPPGPGRPAPPRGTATCALGSLAPGASVAIRIGATPPAVGTATNVAAVSAATPDPRPADNRFTLRTAVAAPRR